jgi:hypothetical protein
LGVGFASSDSVITTGTLGENFSASDITNNLTLAYQDPTDNKWKKITSTTSTWYHRLGIVLDSGNTNDTGKRILLKGRYSGKTFSNINPTFSATTAGDNLIVLGDAAGNTMKAVRLSNAGNGEAIITGGSVRAKKVGAPGGTLGISLVLENNVEQSGTKPSCYPSTTNTVQPLGAVLGSTSINAATLSGVLEDYNYSLSNLKIPAGANFYIVYKMLAAVDPANYYVLGGTNPLTGDSTGTWSDSGGNGYHSLTVSSTSPVGYSVKAYTGSNGSFGVECPASNLWTRVIGTVLSSTEMFFDPEFKREKIDNTAGIHTATTGFFRTMTTNFCPSQLNMVVARRLHATTSRNALHFGSIRGDRAGNTGGKVTGNSNTGNQTDTFLQYGSGGSAGNVVESAIGLGGDLSDASTQNYVHAMRLETGYYLYSSYPGGAANVNGNAAGFTYQSFTFQIEAKQ